MTPYPRAPRSLFLSSSLSVSPSIATALSLYITFTTVSPVIVYCLFLSLKDLFILYQIMLQRKLKSSTLFRNE